MATAAQPVADRRRGHDGHFHGGPRHFGGERGLAAHRRKSFGNDILLAVSCRESGVILVTDNLRDFNRIHAVLPFEFVEAWPVRSAD